MCASVDAPLPSALTMNVHVCVCMCVCVGESHTPLPCAAGRTANHSHTSDSSHDPRTSGGPSQAPVRPRRCSHAAMCLCDCVWGRGWWAGGLQLRLTHRLCIPSHLCAHTSHTHTFVMQSFSSTHRLCSPSHVCLHPRARAHTHTHEESFSHDISTSASEAICATQLIVCVGSPMYARCAKRSSQHLRTDDIRIQAGLSSP